MVTPNLSVERNKGYLGKGGGISKKGLEGLAKKKGVLSLNAKTFKDSEKKSLQRSVGGEQKLPQNPP